MSRKISESGEELCSVCSEVLAVHAIGACSHSICYRCSTRMRVLCDQMYCAICRADLPQVVFTTTRMDFVELDMRKMKFERRYKIFFETQEIKDLYHELQEHRCTLCKGKTNVFTSFNQLRAHVRKEHNRSYCDICVRHLKIFSTERKCYSKDDLAQHRRKGDSDDTSHKGHPLCQFCDERYLDNDLLVLHLRKDHYFCHFCDSDGISNEFYSDYSFMQDHFRKAHFLCEEGDCVDIQFTSCFRTSIDLKSHKANHHSKGMTSAQMRQMRNIEIDINLTERSGPGVIQLAYDNRRYARHPRNDRQQSSQRNRNNQPDLSHSMAVAEMEKNLNAIGVVDRSLMSVMQPQHGRDQIAATNYNASGADFPTLSGESSQPISQSTKQLSRGMSEEFPDLNAAAAKRPASAMPTTRPSVASTVRVPPTTKRPASATATSRSKKTIPGLHYASNQAAWLKLGAEEFPSLQNQSNQPKSQPASHIVTNNKPLSSSKSRPTNKPKAPQKETHKNVPRGAPPYKDDMSSTPAPIRPVPNAANKNPLVAASWNAPTEHSAVESNVGTVKREEPKKAFVKQGSVNIKNASDFPSLGKTVAKKPTLTLPSKPVERTKAAEKPKEEWKSAKTHGNKPAKNKAPAVQKVEKKKKVAAMPAKAKFKLDDDFESVDVNGSTESSGSSLSSKSDSFDFDFSVKSENTFEKTVVPEKLFEKRVESKEPMPTFKEENNNSKKKKADVKKTAPAKTGPTAMDFLKDDVQDQKKKQEKKVTDDINARMLSLLSDDFPTLEPPKPKAVPKHQKLANKPPPGFGPSASTEAPSNRPPPGFASSQVSAADELFPKFYKVDLDAIEATYVKPPDFQNRNKRLIVDVYNALDSDEERFKQFKLTSGAFRKNEIGPADYYCSCAALMGDANFQDIFVQLVSLLPDIRKQQELMIAHKHAMQSMSKKQRSFDWSHMLDTCKHCYQVIMETDAASHFHTHMVSPNDFPSLGGKCAPTNNATWVKAK